jgi:hypothetical protein
VTDVTSRDVALECSDAASRSIENRPRWAGQLRNRGRVNQIAPEMRHGGDEFERAVGNKKGKMRHEAAASSIEAVDPAGATTLRSKQAGDLHHEGFAEAAEDVLIGLDIPGALDDIVIVFVGHDPALL